MDPSNPLFELRLKKLFPVRIFDRSRINKSTYSVQDPWSTVL